MTSPTPALPSFTDGVVPDATPFNALRSNLLNLYQYAVSGFRLRPVPAVIAHVTRKNLEPPDGVDFQWKFDVVDVDTGSMCPAPFRGEFLIVAPGVYRVGCHVQFDPNATGADPEQPASLRITKNGTTPQTQSIAAHQGRAGTEGIFCQTVVPLVRGDVLRFFFAHNTAATGLMKVDFGGCKAWAYWVAP